MAVEAQLYVAFPLLAADGPPRERRRDGGHRHAARRSGGDRRPARPAAADIREPVAARSRRAVRARHRGRRASWARARARSGRPWAWLALAAAAPVFLTIWLRGSVWTLTHLLWVDLAVGPAVACLLVALAAGRPSPLVRMLDSRPIRRLGLASFSLYLLARADRDPRLPALRVAELPPWAAGVPRRASPSCCQPSIALACLPRRSSSGRSCRERQVEQMVPRVEPSSPGSGRLRRRRARRSAPARRPSRRTIGAAAPCPGCCSAARCATTPSACSICAATA